MMKFDCYIAFNVLDCIPLYREIENFIYLTCSHIVFNSWLLIGVINHNTFSRIIHKLITK